MSVGNEFVKKVGLAIAAAMIPEGKPGALQIEWPWVDDGDSNISYDLEEIAPAAIAAMREPTEEMLAAGRHELARPFREKPATVDEVVLSIWRAMVDSALKEDGEAR